MTRLAIESSPAQQRPASPLPSARDGVARVFCRRWPIRSRGRRASRRLGSAVLDVAPPSADSHAAHGSCARFMHRVGVHRVRVCWMRPSGRSALGALGGARRMHIRTYAQAGTAACSPSGRCTCTSMFWCESTRAWLRWSSCACHFSPRSLELVLPARASTRDQRGELGAAGSAGRAAATPPGDHRRADVVMFHCCRGFKDSDA